VSLPPRQPPFAFSGAFAVEAFNVKVPGWQPEADLPYDIWLPEAALAGGPWLPEPSLSGGPWLPEREI